MDVRQETLLLKCDVQITQVMARLQMPLLGQTIEPCQEHMAMPFLQAICASCMCAPWRPWHPAQKPLGQVNECIGGGGGGGGGENSLRPYSQGRSMWMDLDLA